eukprot:40690-Amphidinium_carterae.1
MTHRDFNRDRANLQTDVRCAQPAFPALGGLNPSAVKLECKNICQFQGWTTAKSSHKIVVKRRSSEGRFMTSCPEMNDTGCSFKLHEAPRQLGGLSRPVRRHHRFAACPRTYQVHAQLRGVCNFLLCPCVHKEKTSSKPTLGGEGAQLEVIPRDWHGSLAECRAMCPGWRAILFGSQSLWCLGRSNQLATRSLHSHALHGKRLIPETTGGFPSWLSKPFNAFFPTSLPLLHQVALESQLSRISRLAFDPRDLNRGSSFSGIGTFTTPTSGMDKLRRPRELGKRVASGCKFGNF